MDQEVPVMILPHPALLPVLLLFLLQLRLSSQRQHPLLFFTIATTVIPAHLHLPALRDKLVILRQRVMANVPQKSINARIKAAAQRHLPAPQLALL